MTIPTRRARQKAQLRQEIIDAARDILAREGYEQLSLRTVADRIEYSPTAIYLHFEDKRDLVFHVWEDAFGKLIAELEPLESDVKDPVARLRDGLRRYVAFGLRHPQHYLATLVALPSEQPPEDIARYNNPESNAMRALGLLRSSIQACIDAGKFRKADADVTARAVWAAMHGVTALLIQMPNFAWGDQKAVIESVIDTSIEGLRLRRR
ncbi:MAG TPA: TetR/AcrR family transcriptional regulator [Vicinamibacterales bacterium]|nr:TetR/AcrR family transcriptional regulator [Vicinamibacterales bacterium]